LQDGILCVDVSVVVLLVNLNLLFELFGLGKSKHLAPVVEDLHPIEVRHLLLLDHLRLQVLASGLHTLGLFVKIIHRFVLMTDANHATLVLINNWGTSLYIFSKLHHNNGY